MAYATTLSRTSTSSARRSGPPRSVLGWILDADRRHRDRQALARLDARQLRDIGLTEADVAKMLGR